MALTKITRGVIKPNENYDTHNINSTGIVTATQFHGDGSNLTGLADPSVLTVGGATKVEAVLLVLLLVIWYFNLPQLNHFW